VRHINAKGKVINLLDAGQTTISKLSAQDFSERFTPGEWCTLQGKERYYLVYLNPHAEDGVLLKVCASGKNANEWVSPISYIEKKLQEAYDYRLLLLGKAENCRLFYGATDGVPGLSIDTYENAVIAEINTFGCWLYRDYIDQWLKRKYLGKQLVLRVKSTRKETLPDVEGVDLTEPLKIIDNQLNIHIEMSKIQKIGYYFDHSGNRQKLERLIYNLINQGHKFDSGLDLFCYVGSWGLALIRAGLSQVDFVDQGDFAGTIKENIRLNGMENSGGFYREDVFKFLERMQKDRKKYDIIVSDPPAMAKRPDQKTQSLRGYSKIHLGCLKLARKGSIFIAASCTSYISNEELEQTVITSAEKLSLKLRLLDIGLQSWDHPTKGLKVEENYIKYLCYIVL
jgi:23S rRNA (cytosine1962-C5)-methyltransferase